MPPHMRHGPLLRSQRSLGDVACNSSISWPATSLFAYANKHPLESQLSYALSDSSCSARECIRVDFEFDCSLYRDPCDRSRQWASVHNEAPMQRADIGNDPSQGRSLSNHFLCRVTQRIFRRPAQDGLHTPDLTQSDCGDAPCAISRQCVNHRKSILLDSLLIEFSLNLSCD